MPNRKSENLMQQSSYKKFHCNQSVRLLQSISETDTIQVMKTNKSVPKLVVLSMSEN